MIRTTSVEESLSDSMLEDIYYTFRPRAWAHDVVEPALDIKLDSWQMDFLADTRDRIVLDCARQIGKSTTTAIKAVHMAVYRPGSTILLISPTMRQSGELFHRVKEIVTALGDHAPRLKVDNVTSLELTSGSRIISVPATDNIRGYSVDMVIMDEAAYISDDMRPAVSPMLFATHGQMVMISTPDGKSGMYWDAYCSDMYAKYVVPVTDVPRMQTPDKLRYLEAEYQDKGGRIFGQEYLCKFLSDVEGSVFKRAWLDGKIVETVPDVPMSRCRYWDMAATAEDIKRHNDPDFTAGVRMAYDESSGRVYIEDVVHIRADPYGCEQVLRATAESDGHDVRICQEQEGGSAGKTVTAAYARTIFRGYDYRPKKASAKGSKMRASSPFAAACERGDVYLVDGPWVREYLDELTEFPLGKHDDMVDASSGAYADLTLSAVSPNIWFM